MAFLSHSKKEIKAKIVYYGPGLSGKTSNIEYIHGKMRSDHRGDLVNLSTSDRTLFFDFLPVELGNIKGYRTRFHIFTVPGQIFYNETRRTVLKDVDGIVFVADSQKKMKDDNIRSLKNLDENLSSYGKKLQEIPHVFQYNKRDLPDVLSLEDLHRQLNRTNAPFFEAVATTGNGVLNTLKLVSKMVLKKLATGPTTALEESDEAFEENNYGLSKEYQVVAPGAEVKDQESVIHATEIDVPSGEIVQGEAASEGPTEAPPAEPGTEIEVPENAPVHSQHAPGESYEAEIHNEIDESEIPTPPTHEEIEEAETPPPSPEATPEPQIAEAPPIAVEEKPAESVIENITPAPTETISEPPPQEIPPVQAEASPAPQAPLSMKELSLYQWGMPESINQNTIRVPLFFRDPETQEEYWSYITISLDNIFKRL